MYSTLFCVIAAALTAACSIARAADDIRYVSTSGKNNNACSLAAPCRSLQHAIRKTPAGGDIQILDSGFFGNNATIRKSLTISGNGNTVFLGAPIVIDQAGAVVALRGLTLDGRGTTVEGIRINAATVVHIERCTIQSFSNDGIEAAPSGGHVFIIDSRSRDNGGHGAQSRASLLTVDNSHFDNNRLAGVQVLSGNAAVNRSTASANGDSGVEVIDASAAIMSTLAAQNGLAGFLAAQGSSMTVESSIATGNGDAGVHVNGEGVARISNSTLTGNKFGIRNLGSTIETRGNNSVRGNTNNVSGTRTPIDGV